MSLPAPPSPPAKRSSRVKRGCLIIVSILALLGPALYWYENYSGRQSLKAIVSAYADAGFSLDPAAILPHETPAAANFGATPLLDGIMHPVDDSAAGESAREKRAFLEGLSGYHMASNGWSSMSTQGIWPCLHGLRIRSGLRLTKDLYCIHDQDPAWNYIRTSLGTAAMKGNAEVEPSDIRAVYQAIESHRAIFDELIAAAKRPQAILTPSPRDRMELWRQDQVVDPSGGVEELARLILLRARSAAGIGNLDEATALTSVLWKLRCAWLAESTCRATGSGLQLEGFWLQSVRTMLRARDVNDSQLGLLLTTCGPRWSPEEEIVQSWRGEVAFLYTAFQGTGAQVFQPPRWGFSGGQENMLKFGPSGWVEQNLTTGLRNVLHCVLEPLSARGFGALPRACDGWSNGYDWSPYRFLHVMSHGDLLVHVHVMHAEHVRLTLLAIAMERFRLRHQRYPESHTSLVPDCIGAVPPDLDGVPLRFVTSPDGTKSVLYSVGWNLTDDWHGIIPATCEESDFRNDDWPLVLPFPPLPAP